MQFKRDTESADTLVLLADEGINDDVDELVSQLERQLDQGAKKLVVDGSNLRHISSRGMGALVRLHHRIVKRGGDMALAAFTPVPVLALQMTRLDRVFGLHETVAEAREALKCPQPRL